MTQRSSIAKIIAVTSSLTLFGAYVWHSHITPNTPPPDPLGLSSLEQPSKPEASQFDALSMTRSDLRIITTKSISQPIFSVRKLSPWKRPMLPGSKSAPIEISRHTFRLNEGLPVFDLFHSPAPPP